MKILSAILLLMACNFSKANQSQTAESDQIELSALEMQVDANYARRILSNVDIKKADHSNCYYIASARPHIVGISSLDSSAARSILGVTFRSQVNNLRRSFANLDRLCSDGSKSVSWPSLKRLADEVSFQLENFENAAALLSNSEIF